MWPEKLLLARSIRELGEQELARQVMEQQLKMGWPGLVEEVAVICQAIGLPDVARKDVTKEEIKEKIVEHHQMILKEEMKTKKKLKDLANHDLRVPRPYLATMNLGEARMAVKLETRMLDIASNMKARYKENMACQACNNAEEETQEHLEECDGYTHIRSNYDLIDMVDKARFFSKLMLERAKEGRVRK